MHISWITNCGVITQVFLLQAPIIQCQKQTDFYKFIVCQKCFITYTLEACLSKGGI